MTDGGETLSLVMMLVVSSALAAYGGFMWYEQHRGVTAYQPTEATVVSSQVTEDLTSEYRAYYAEVTYRYSVDGRTYTNHNVQPGPGYWFRGEQWAQSVVDDHPEGATVTAYYDPANPSEAFLVKETSPWPPVLVGVGLLFGGLGVQRLGREFGLISG